MRRKLNQPGYLTETLTSLADVYTALGNYNKSLSTLQSALDVTHKANDTAGTAGVSEAMGAVLVLQGRLGAAVSAMQDAVKGYRAVNNRGLEMATALYSLADTLALAGRGAEAGKLLDEAQEIARDLKNENINGELLNTRGDVAFYKGDFKVAKSYYEQAAAAAAKGKQKGALLLAKMNLARVAIADGHFQSAVAALRVAIKEAEKLPNKYYAIRGTVDLNQALVACRRYKMEELYSAESQTKQYGVRLEMARTQYLLGDAFRLRGDTTEAAEKYFRFIGILTDIMKEPGAEHLSDRFDLREMNSVADREIAAAH